MTPATTLSALDALPLAPIGSPARVSESAPPPAPGPLVRVSESYATTLGDLIGGDPYALFVGGDPALAARYGGFWAANRVTLPNHAPSGFFTEQQLWVAISWSRWICQENLLAKAFLDRVASYVGAMAVQFVRDGEEPGATSSGIVDRDGDGEPDADPLVQLTQHWFDRWCKAEDWGRGTEDRERECRLRLIRDGNVILRFGCGGPDRRGLPWVRFVEPEQLRTPTGRVPDLDGHDPRELNWSHGVCTLKRDAETVLGYWIYDPESGDGEFVPARYVVRLKANVDRTIKMGLPDFYPAEQQLQKALGILANSGATAHEQAGVAWIQEYATATADQVRTLLSQGTESYARPGAGVPAAAAAGTPIGAHHFVVKQYGTTRVVHADANRQFKPGPVSEGVPGFMQIVEATLRAVGKLWGLEDWFGGSSSFASALVENSEFVQHIRDRQQVMTGFAEKVAAVVMMLLEEAGVLPGGTAAALEPVVTAPNVIAADEEKQVRTWITELDKRLVDPQEIIKKRNRDPKVVIANIRAWEKEFPPNGQPPASPNGQPNTPAPTNSTATPPGSAGGDGSSPNTPDPITARESAGPHAYSCVMAPLDGEARLKVLDLGRMVRDEDLAGDGREAEPHVTVRYGLETDDPGAVLPIVRRSGPLALRLGALSVFSGPDADVLKAEVEGDGLRRLHEALGAVPHTDTHPTYQPHATIAYVKPGLGAIYARLLPTLGVTCEVGRVVFSDRAQGRHVTPLDAGRVAESLLGEHFGVTDDGYEWVSESAYALVSEADRSHLVKKQIEITRNGKTYTTTVYVKPEQAAPVKKKATADDRDRARAAVSAALKNPGSVDPAELAAHLATLTRDEIAGLNKGAGVKGGRLKGDKIDRLLEHIRGKRGTTKKGGLGDGRAGTDERATAGDGGRVAGAAERPRAAGANQGGDDGGQSAGDPTAGRVPATVAEAHRRIERYQSLFRANGQHQVADWLGDLHAHIGAVGDEGLADVLAGLGDPKSADAKGAQYELVGSALQKSAAGFLVPYLDRFGITAVGEKRGGAALDPGRPVVSGLARDSGGFARAPGKGKAKGAGDNLPANSNFKDKLAEAQSLPGLESSADLSDVAGKKVTHLTPDVVAKLDEKYGAGGWIVKPYGLTDGRAGQGIFFPQRAAQLASDARSTIWTAGSELAKHGFVLARDESGTVTGLKHSDGTTYAFGSPEYDRTVYGDARQWGDRAAGAAAHEHGAALPGTEGLYMSQPAFPVVGVSGSERAAGVTIKQGSEGRVHVVTRNGKASAVPYATWIKGDALPVVFESDDTRAMARAAEDAINAIPESERTGQLYAPDVIKTADGYRVVEANPSTKQGISGYLHDNPLVIDAYVSHVTGREPGHVQFIRKLLSKRAK